MVECLKLVSLEGAGLVDVTVKEFDDDPLLLYVRDFLLLADDFEQDYMSKYSLANLRSMDPTDFEHFIADIYRELGWSVRTTKGSSDRGIDLIAVGKQDDERIKKAIQVKRYSKDNKVSGPEIRQYAGIYARDSDIDEVVVITTGSFTKQARREARESNVKIIDSSKLRRLIQKSGIKEEQTTDETPEIEVSIDKFKPTRRQLIAGISVFVAGVAGIAILDPGRNLGGTVNVNGIEVTVTDYQVTDSIQGEEGTVRPGDYAWVISNPSKFLLVTVHQHNTSDSERKLCCDYDWALLKSFGLGNKKIQPLNIHIDPREGDFQEYHGDDLLPGESKTSILIFPVQNSDIKGRTIQLSHIFEDEGPYTWELEND